MSVITTALKELIKLGVEGDALIAAIERLEAAAYEESLLDLKTVVDAASVTEDLAFLSSGAARTRRYRERKASQGVTKASPSVTEASQGVTERHQPLSPPSLSPEPPNPPTPIREYITTREAKAVRGTRLDPGWEPSKADFDFALAAGLTPEETERGAREFRNYWCARSRDAARVRWDLTWQNHVDKLADRKRERDARLAGQAAPRGRGQGPADFAEIIARRRSGASF